MKVLIVEDSERLGRSLGRGLRGLGYTVDVVENGEDGLAFAETYDYDVIVLDLMLPGLPGLDVLKQLRAGGRATHILVLSAQDRVEDRVNGLRLGADDYLVKPFAFDELAARLQALVRRRYQAKSPTLRVGPLEIDTARKRVSRRGGPVHLTPAEYRLLEFLAYQPRRVFSQDQLLAHLHQSDADVSGNAVEVLVSALRRKIHVRGEPAIVRTQRGFGYFVE
jgi:DNA-binding response OmpR family regulator